MNSKRTLHIICVCAGLVGLGAMTWWVGQRMLPMVDRTTSIDPGALPASRRVPPPVPVAEKPAGRIPSGLTSIESRERSAMRAKVVAGQQELARAQEAALAGLSEADLDSALADFAQSHQRSITDAAGEQGRYLHPGEAPAALPEATAMQVRFAAVRRAIIDDGLSLEEAESQFHQAPSNP